MLQNQFNPKLPAKNIAADFSHGHTDPSKNEHIHKNMSARYLAMKHFCSETTNM